MGYLFLVARLVWRSILRRRGEAVMLVLALAAGTTTLTLGLVLHGEQMQPYTQTRNATNGPDLEASIFPGQVMAKGPGPVASVPGGPPVNPVVTTSQIAQLTAMEKDPGVTAHSGPYPATWAAVDAHGVTAAVEVEGRDQAAAAVDQPKVTSGTWLRPGGVVVERTFADALGGVHPGDTLTLNGHRFTVDGIAVTAAFTPYPQICAEGCILDSSQVPNNDPGLVWASRATAQSLATSAEPLVYYLNLKLADPLQATAIANAAMNSIFNNADATSNAPFVTSWEQIATQDGNLVKGEQTVMLIASWLLGLLAIGSVTVLVGGRMADQLRRTGLLKAVGATPRLVAGVLLAEYLFLALSAAAVGVGVGWLLAPVMGNPGAGLLGTAGPPALNVADIALVVAVALGIAVIAAAFPALRAARTSTVRALVDAARAPRRRKWMIALSASLPVPLLIGMRVVARRPRRTVLGVLSIAVTVSGIVTVLYAHASVVARQMGVSPAGLLNPRTERINQVLFAITASLAALAAVNAVFIARAMVQDARHTSAITRALGATPQQVTLGIAAAQTVPALLGALLGIPGGLALYSAVKHGSDMITPPAWEFGAVVLGTVMLVGVLTAIPARFGAGRPVVDILQAELA